MIPLEIEAEDAARKFMESGGAGEGTGGGGGGSRRKVS